MNTQAIMTVTRLLFTQTGTYNDMALRPYVTNTDQGTLNALQEATLNGQNLQPSVLAGVAGNIIRPSTHAVGGVSIVNGWDIPRLRFVMEILHHDSALGDTIQYLSGYTDQVGVSWASGAVDRNMQLHINNTITTRRVQEFTPVGTQNRQTVTSAAQVLTGNYQPDFANLNRNIFTMRPQDVFNSVGASVLDQSSQIFDTRAAFSAGNVKLSARSNTAAPVYLSRVMKGYQTAMSTADNAEDLPAIMEKAMGTIPEPTLSQDKFFGIAQRHHRALVENSYITYGELEAMSPNLELVAQFVRQGNTAYMAHHERGMSEHWQGTTNETVMATVLSHSIPSIMMDLMLTKLAFVVTNQTLDGSFKITYTHVQGFTDGVDLTPYIRHFEHRLFTEVLRDLSRNNQLGLNLVVQLDIIGDTVIDISLNSAPSIRYVTPSFCDALMSPVITNNNMNLQTLANDITSLVENMNVDHSVHTSQYPAHFQGPPGNNYGNSDTL